MSGRAGLAGAILLALYLASGITGLWDEVLWARALGLAFGTSFAGTGIAVAAYLLGLGAGALLGLPEGRTAASFLRLFALAECAVAAFDLALPGLLPAGLARLDQFAPLLGPVSWHALETVCALVMLALPAAALGAAFPWISRALQADATQLGRLYAVNCLGAAAGSMLALAALAHAGWVDAIRLAGLCGLGVGLAAYLLSFRLPADPRNDGPSPASPASAPMSPASPWRTGTGPRRALAAYALVGAAAITLELCWTRLFGVMFLRTEYVLALVLAVILAGLAAGSALEPALARRRIGTRTLSLAACGLALGGLALLAPAAAWLEGHPAQGLASALFQDALILLALVFPASVCLGAWLPGLVREHAPAQAPRAGAAFYAANCGGGAAGALLTLYVGLPLAGSASTLALAALTLPVAALLAGARASGAARPGESTADALAGARRPVPQALAPALALAALGLLAWSLRALPPPASWRPVSLGQTREIYRYEDALSLHQVVALPDGQRLLLADMRHQDAASDPAAVRVQADQVRLALRLKPGAHSVMLLGLGTGISASAALEGGQRQVVAVEISPGAIVAARDWFSAVNADAGHRVTVVTDDARHAMVASTQPCDLIVGDLFHPDLAGMARLLSVEHFRRVRMRLAPGGVFVQWVALNQFDPRGLQVVLRSFAAAFADARLYIDALHLALVGGGAAQDAGAMLAAGTGEGGEDGFTWLGRYAGRIRVPPGPLQSEWAPRVEFALPALDGDAAGRIDATLGMLLRMRPDAESARRELGVPSGEGARFEAAYLANELALESWQARLREDPQRAAQRLELAYLSNPADRWVAGTLADELLAGALAKAGDPGARQAAADRALAIDPENPEALRLRWQTTRLLAPAQAQVWQDRLARVAPLDAQAAALPPGRDAPAVSGRP
jgi:spermidine synthase